MSFCVDYWNTQPCCGPPAQSYGSPGQQYGSQNSRNPEPPACVQNAMMTKDKKPFTYTPGGIDLSEIRSPRMAKRIERNANAPGVGEVPRSPNTYHPSGPLPPQAMAAMQNNMPVQVFPQGAAPPPPPPPPPSSQPQNRGGAPPPPPPPPPPPTQPLPTQKVSTNEGVFDRPDMTRIIPDNPMAMLRKTPRMERKTFLDELADMERSNNSRPVPQQQQVMQTSTPGVRSVPGPYSPQPHQQQQQPMYAPAMSPPMQQQYSPPVYQQEPPPPPVRQASPPQQRQDQYSPQYRPQQQHQQQQPQYNNGHASPVPSTTNGHQPRSSQVGSLYIPPVAAPNTNNDSPMVPPSPPQRQQSQQQPQSPGSPGQVTLNKAPRPWQNQKREAEQKPAWAQRAERESPPQSQSQGQYSPQPIVQQPDTPQSAGSYTPQLVQMQQQQQQPFAFNQPHMMMYPNQQQQMQDGVRLSQPPPPQPGVEVVWITQPQVFQHPGGNAPFVVPQQQQQPQQWQQESPRPQQQPKWNQQQQQQLIQQQQMQQQQLQQQQMQQQQLQQQQMQQQQMRQQQSQNSAKNERIIPIQIEGSTPVLNRQQSMGGPPQSNSFKVLQKMTSTDGDQTYYDEPTTEHGPKSSQEYQQAQTDQLRRMKIGGDDRDLVHKFKQAEFYVVTTYTENEDPRYRGGYIPSHIFRLLDESDDGNYLRQETDPRYRGPNIPSKAFRLLEKMTESSPSCSLNSVPIAAQQQSSHQVRTIPIQVESEESSRPYVHPSQQTVPEPKKYMGGNIPGRSFKVLQAMTQGNELAKNYECYEPPPYMYHMYPPPPSPYYDYWNYYYSQFPQQVVQEDSETKHPETEPVQNTPQTESESVCSSCRNTPVPFYYYPNPAVYYTDSETDCEDESNSSYHPGWDPYYYPYYYYYPPPPFNVYRQERNNDATDTEGYSTNDEIAYYNQQPNHTKTEEAIVKTPEIVINTSTVEISDDCSSESDDEDIPEARRSSSGSLQSIKSVQNMKSLSENIVEESEASDTETIHDDTDADDEYTESKVIQNDDLEETTDRSDCLERDEDSEEECVDIESDVQEVDDTIPHALSIIFEETENSYSTCKTQLSRDSSAASFLSDDTIVVDDESNELDEDDKCEEAQKIKPSLSLTYSVSTDNDEDDDNNLEATFTITSPKSSSSSSIGSNISDLVDAEDKKPIQNESEDVDFWSQIQTEDELVPKRNRLDAYKNACGDTEVVRKRSRVVDEIEGSVTHRVKETRRNSFADMSIKVSDNKLETVQVDKTEFGVSTFEVKTKCPNDGDIANADVNDNDADVNCEAFKSSTDFEETDDALIKVSVEDFKLSNLVFERRERKHVLQAPDLDFDFGCNKEHISLKKIDDSESKLISPLYPKSEDVSENEEEYDADMQEKLSTDYVTESDETDVEREGTPQQFSDGTDSEEEVKTNDTLDTVMENKITTEDNRRSTICMIDEIEPDQPELCSLNSSHSSSLSRSSSVSEGLDAEQEEAAEETDDESDEAPVKVRVRKVSEKAVEEVAVVEMPSIKDRIRALQEASSKPIKKISAPAPAILEELTPDKDRLISKTSSLSSKSIDNSEDEGDSGVTSDMSRHISDTESEFSELRKMSRYKRAATHSRLFQLLQGDCLLEEDQESDAENTQSANKEDMMSRRQHLRLPLKPETGSSISSSELNSPTSPLTDKLAKELVLSLLRKKKGKIFRDMPMERLHAAAMKILQEDKDCTDLSSSEEFHNCLSPLRTDTESSTPALTPKEFLHSNSYTDYYDSWDTCTNNVPLNAIHGDQSLSKTTAKCPRVTRHRKSDVDSQSISVPE